MGRYARSQDAASARRRIGWSANPTVRATSRYPTSLGAIGAYRPSVTLTDATGRLSRTLATPPTVCAITGSYGGRDRHIASRIFPVRGRLSCARLMPNGRRAACPTVGPSAGRITTDGGAEAIRWHRSASASTRAACAPMATAGARLGAACAGDARKRTTALNGPRTLTLRGCLLTSNGEVLPFVT